VRKKERAPLVGGSSLLVIFAVLCLTVFALLTLSTVEAGGRLSERAARSLEAYYAADARAEEILTALRDQEIIENGLVKDEGDGVVSYMVPIDETQALRVRVRVEAQQAYQVLQWQAVSTASWEASDKIEVWDGLVPQIVSPKKG